MRRAPLEVLDKMALEMSVHGLRYVAPSQGHAPWARVAWGAAVVSGAALAALLALGAWQDYVTSPTATVVKSTHWPLHAAPFPAVSVCPTTRLLAAPALRLLGAVATPAELRHVLSALSLLHRPHYARAARHLRAAGAVLGRLSAVNVTELMLRSLPPCAALFLGCYWRGAQIDCCSEFRLQRSEAGFCYSFNSMTAEATLHCASDPRGPECVVRHNTAAGAASGLEVFMAKDVGHDRELEIAQGDVDGFRVSIHPPSEFPEPSLLVASWEAGSRPRVTAVHVQVSVTESAPQVRRLPPASRQCFFPDERQVRLTPVYSQRTCLAECRLRSVAAACACRPYFLPPAADAVPECRLDQLPCVAAHLRRPSACGGDACLASCLETLYSTDVLLVDDSNPTAANASAYLDVFFSQLGVVKYERDLTFDSLQLLVSVGGVASLFLGVSLLSVVELLYWLLRLLWSLSR